MRSVLAVVCPPLAVLSSGSKSEAVKNAGLTLCLFVPGVVHALGVVDRYHTERRYDAVMRAMAATAA
jgi:uncharacterized membrane protein YqaE (UPF0057 family)